MLKCEHTDRFTFIILENKYHLLAMMSWLKEGQTHFYFQKPNFLEAAEGVKDGICSLTELVPIALSDKLCFRLSHPLLPLELGLKLAPNHYGLRHGHNHAHLSISTLSLVPFIL